jgi:hypothetical protein
VSQKYVPLTIIKGAGHEYIPIPEGESAIVADFHSYVNHIICIFPRPKAHDNPV